MMQRRQVVAAGPRPNSSGPVSCCNCCISRSLVIRQASMGRFVLSGVSAVAGFLRRRGGFCAGQRDAAQGQRHGGAEQAEAIFAGRRSGDTAFGDDAKTILLCRNILSQIDHLVETVEHLFLSPTQAGEEFIQRVGRDGLAGITSRRRIDWGVGCWLVVQIGRSLRRERRGAAMPRC